MARVLHDHGTLQAWSDGSHVGNIMGHGFMVRKKNYYDEPIITGWGRSLDGSVKSSLRAEHCGVLSILALILAIEKIEGMTVGGKIELYVDNMTVVNRIKEEKIDDNEKTDCDLWRMSLYL